jgi:acyl-CoA thioesterase
LLIGLLERTSPRDDMVLARVTVEILGAVPIAEVEVETSVERHGRSVELLAGELRADARPVLRARAWRVLASPVGTPEQPPAALPVAAQQPPETLGEAFGYAHAIEWRWASGGWEQRGPASVWTRMRIPLVEGDEPTPRQRVMVVADSGNGASNVLDWSRYLFINTELSVHFLREPVGEWVLLDARTQIAEGGAGLASSVLSDRSGPVARGAQALLVAPR